VINHIKALVLNASLEEIGWACLFIAVSFFLVVMAILVIVGIVSNWWGRQFEDINNVENK